MRIMWHKIIPKENSNVGWLERERPTIFLYSIFDGMIVVLKNYD